MIDLERGPFWRLFDSLCGAFVAAIVAIMAQYWGRYYFGPINWHFVRICAVFGFFLAALFGKMAVDFLAEILKSLAGRR